jgi:ribosomal-protein-alanine N-acetyltransferase
VVDNWLKEEKDPKTIRFIITLKDNDEPIGSIDVVGYIDDNPEIGYCLARKYWNQGLMTEACKALIKYLFDIGFKKIFIKAMVENIGSNKVIEKCDFKFTHREYREHQSAFKAEPATLNCYELVK